MNNVMSIEAFHYPTLFKRHSCCNMCNYIYFTLSQPGEIPRRNSEQFPASLSLSYHARDKIRRDRNFAIDCTRYKAGNLQINISTFSYTETKYSSRKTISSDHRQERFTPLYHFASGKGSTQTESFNFAR